MSREALTELLEKRPFCPFRLHTNASRSYDVLNPEAAALTRLVLILGVGWDTGSGTFDHTLQVPICNIVRIEPIEDLALVPEHQRG